MCWASRKKSVGDFALLAATEYILVLDLLLLIDLMNLLFVGFCLEVIPVLYFCLLLCKFYLLNI